MYPRDTERRSFLIDLTLFFMAKCLLPIVESETYSCQNGSESTGIHESKSGWELLVGTNNGSIAAVRLS